MFKSCITSLLCHIEYKMSCSNNMKIYGENVMLVPYRKTHVKNYYNWMQSEQLRTLMFSDVNTLEKAKAMQKSFSTENNKSMFIILNRNDFKSSRNENNSMIGDTSLCMSIDGNRTVAEVKIMIAEPNSRSNHFGWEAMLLMLIYGVYNFHIMEFFVNVGENNLPAIGLFEKLGFIEIDQNKELATITLGKLVEDEWIMWLRDQGGCNGGHGALPLGHYVPSPVRIKLRSSR